jgi:hypothetical protein
MTFLSFLPLIMVSLYIAFAGYLLIGDALIEEKESKKE